MVDRAVISKLLEVDPEFPAFFDALNGISKMADPSEVHVNGADPKRERKLAATGLAATGVAGVGGLHALVGTKAEHEVKLARVAAGGSPGKIVGRLKGISPGKAVALGTAGWTALHGVELVGDALGARAQAQKLRDTKVTKAHFQPVSLVHANARVAQVGLRKPGATFRRVRGAVPVAKALPKLTKLVGEERIGGFRPVRARPYNQPEDEHFARHQAVMPKRRLTRVGVLVAGGGGGVGALTAADVARSHQTKKKMGFFEPDPTAAPVSKRCGFTAVAEIAKFDVEKRQVFGWASLSEVDGQPVTDRQGDYIDIAETESAAYGYMLRSRVGGDMHSRIVKADAGPKHTADVIESVVITPEKLEAWGLERDALPLGWWLGMQVNDEQQWQDVKDGKRTGFSVHGTGVRKEMEIAA